VHRVVELEFPPRNDHLVLVRLLVESTAAIDGRLARRHVHDLRLAVSEASANAVDAQRAVGSALPVHLRLELDDERIVATITDHAGGFDPDDVAAIPAATDPSRLRHERGLGIPLMRSLVDEVRFERTPDGTAVHLVSRA
jgi:anti-sigma regulatory factor (Ser/Thr protein kinase)